MGLTHFFANDVIFTHHWNIVKFICLKSKIDLKKLMFYNEKTKKGTNY